MWEACLLVRSLLSDPRSRVAAQIAGWEHPVSREWMLLAEIRDVTIDVSAVRNPAKYHLPRPWRNAGRPKRKPRTMPELRRALKPWG